MRRCEALNRRHCVVQCVTPPPRPLCLLQRCSRRATPAGRCPGISSPTPCLMFQTKLCSLLLSLWSSHPYSHFHCASRVRKSQAPQNQASQGSRHFTHKPPLKPSSASSFRPSLDSSLCSKPTTRFSQVSSVTIPHQPPPRLGGRLNERRLSGVVHISEANPFACESLQMRSSAVLCLLLPCPHVAWK